MATYTGRQDAHQAGSGNADLHNGSRVPLDSERAHQEHYHILLVDDVEVYREMGRVILKRLGHRVSLAANGDDAALMACRQKFDMIFMDIQMPVSNGFSATSRIRAHEKKSGGRVPIIAMTCATHGMWERFLCAGMDDYLPKPVQRHDITAMIDRHLTRGQADAGAPAATGRQSPHQGAGIQAAEPETAPGQLPVFDREALLELLGGDEALMGKFITLYLNTVGQYLDKLSAALFLGDIEQVQVQAHTVKGAAINVGAVQVSNAAYQLESLARSGSLAGAIALYDDLMKAAVRFRERVVPHKGCDTNDGSNR